MIPILEYIQKKHIPAKQKPILKIKDAEIGLAICYDSDHYHTFGTINKITDKYIVLKPYITYKSWDKEIGECYKIRSYDYDEITNGKYKLVELTDKDFEELQELNDYMNKVGEDKIPNTQQFAVFCNGKFTGWESN